MIYLRPEEIGGLWTKSERDGLVTKGTSGLSKHQGVVTQVPGCLDVELFEAKAPC